MEGFFESFIYILITVVILVLSMRKKKPVTPESEEGEISGSDDPFADVFKEEDEEDYSTGPKPATVPTGTTRSTTPGTMGEQQATPWMSEKEAKKMVMDADAVMKEAMDNNPIAQFEGTVKGDAYNLDVADNERVPFDLKRAVIHSEILNRREF